MDEPTAVFPATLEVDYADGPRNRLTTFFRLFAAIPILIVLALVSGPGFHTGAHGDVVLASGGVLFAATMLMLLFRRKYPRWWFDWNLALTKFSFRVFSYLALLRDEYPATDDEQHVHVAVRYPEAATELSRWLPLVKWLLAIPHVIVLALLAIAAIACVVVAWFAILSTGRYPQSLFAFVVGVLRWGLRVSAYAFLLTTDRYPPFSWRA